MDFTLIDSGTFFMGSAEGIGDEDEELVHEVSITELFYTGIHELTQEKWECIMGYNPSSPKGDYLLEALFSNE